MSVYRFKGGALALRQGDLDGTPDLRAMLVMSDSTVVADIDALKLSNITDLDEYDGANYAREDLGSIAWSADDANNRYELAAALADFGSATIGAGSRNILGVVVYLYVDGTAANDVPIYFVTDLAGLNGGGGKIEWTPNATTGLLFVPWGLVS